MDPPLLEIGAYDVVDVAMVAGVCGRPDVRLDLVAPRLHAIGEEDEAVLHPLGDRLRGALGRFFFRDGLGLLLLHPPHAFVLHRVEAELHEDEVRLDDIVRIEAELQFHHPPGFDGVAPVVQLRGDPFLHPSFADGCVECPLMWR